ncbi:uncharacterized protein J4E84_010659 [Alternaria hordeiaustralica]|uniref:uncharacterized protein n=1 Tax=Alternaria hordeiaustralica TaxID=1187925 RepID=UPI0020C53621|nr:uncharacterized protein J4E84_010659 [Alternaria hordeiaustralica]KAI4674284.1 hypothetical protein J4E84_010659 [Alternaria hordeiaustralica]
MPKSNITQAKPNSQPTLPADEPASVFEFFDSLPAELQSRIIKYAWNNAIHASPLHLHADIKFRRPTSAASVLAASIPCSVNYRVHASVNRDITLHLTSKFFSAECKFLAKPHHLHLPVSNSNGSGSAATKPCLFIPDKDTLHINIKGEMTYKYTVLSAFAILPKLLREMVKHIDIDYTDAQDMLELCMQLGPKGSITSLIGGLGAPRLETVTISVCSLIVEGNQRMGVLPMPGREGKEVEMRVKAVDVREGLTFWERIMR